MTKEREMPTVINSRRRGEPLTRKEMAKRVCYGVFITSVWLGVNGIFWWGMEIARQKIKLVDDYGEFEFELDFDQVEVDLDQLA